ncbi:NAD(P)-dependent oxidoreductase [Lysinibacillus fusiformis]|uniref:NAD-dependent epimerase/dehydratase family protein n=1 Tax=Lysinibacillus fusiformis TaxID=28031 RepID=UPI003019A847
MENNNKKVAILGATSHVAKNLIYYFSVDYVHMVLFARDFNHLRSFINLNISTSSKITVEKFENFSLGEYDVIINCVGIGNPEILKKMGGEILILTEKFDNLILDYLYNNSDTLYINFSSGAAYGTDFTNPADENKGAMININNISSADYYTVSKINSEAKHRGLSELNIVDLRIFGFYSRFINEDMPYFLNEVFNSLKNKKKFITTDFDFKRDFIHPSDLVRMVQNVMKIKNINTTYDVYSLQPISKWDLLNYLSKRYYLEVEIEHGTIPNSVTGIKSNYYSISKLAEEIGYQPNYSSLDAVLFELNSKLSIK